MLNLLLTRIIAAVAKQFAGKKTIIGGVGSILTGLVGIAGIMFPDQGLPAMDIGVALGFITGGFAVLGIGGKLESQKSATVDQNALVAEQNEILKRTVPLASSTETVLTESPK